MWKESESRSVVSDSLRLHGLYSPWNSPGQNTGVGSRSLLQGVFPTQRSNPGLPRCRWILYQLGHQGSPNFVGSSLLAKVLSVTVLPYKGNTAIQLLMRFNLWSLPLCYSGVFSLQRAETNSTNLSSCSFKGSPLASAGAWSRCPTVQLYVLCLPVGSHPSLLSSSGWLQGVAKWVFEGLGLALPENNTSFSFPVILTKL